MAADSDVVAGAVISAVQATLPLGDHAVHRTTALRSLPEFNSFRLLEIIDRVEASLGVAFPADVAAGDLADIAGLCRLFERAFEEPEPGRP